jgi:D-specific alpha-keto acid dehydrogenase
MTLREQADASIRGESLKASTLAAGRRTGLTIYGCEPDEAALFHEFAPRYGLTPTVVEAPLSGGNADVARGDRCVSVSHKSAITSSVLLALSQAGVRYLSTRSAGHNHIDVEHATRVGITVGNVAYSPDSVADYTLMLMLMAIRDAKSVLRRADSYDYRLSDVRGRELRDLTVGVIGTGRIGAAVVARLQSFGCRVLAYDVRPKTAATYVSLDDLVRHSDIVTLHTPLNSDSHHLLSRHRIGQLKQGAVVVNTGRGALLDTEALLEALESGRLAGAALDVVEGEEGIFYENRGNGRVEGGLLSRLQRLPNAIISPHTAYYTDRALRDTVENTIVNCLAFEREMTTWTG